MHVLHIQLDHIRKAVRTAKKYVGLYARKWHGDRKGFKKLHTKELKELMEMEGSLDYRTIVDLRELALWQLHQDDAKKGRASQNMTEQQLIIIGASQKAVAEKAIVAKKVSVAAGDQAECVQLRVALQIAALRVSLSMHGKPLLDLQLKELTVDLSKKASSSTIASVCIQQIDVSDRYTPSAIFPKVLSSQGDQPFFKLQYEDAVTAERDELTLTITTAPIRVAFNHSIVGVMTEFAQMSDDSVFDEDIQVQINRQLEEQKTLLMEQLGQQIAKDAHAHIVRKSILTLNLTLSGPVFIVPQCCSSTTSALVVDFGCLKIEEDAQNSSGPRHRHLDHRLTSRTVGLGTVSNPQYNKFNVSLEDFDIRLEKYSPDGTKQDGCSLIDTDGLQGTVWTDKKKFDPTGTNVKADLELPSAKFTISEDNIKALADLGASVQSSLAPKPRETMAKKKKNKQTLLQRKKAVVKGAVGNSSERCAAGGVGSDRLRW